MTRKRRREEEPKQISKQSSQESPVTSRHKSSSAVADAQVSGKTKKRKDAEPKPVNSNWMQLQASLGKKNGDSRKKESTTHDADKDLIAAAEGIISRPVPINPPLLVHIAKESPSLKACWCFVLNRWRTNGATASSTLSPTSDDMSVTKVLALDCEMVGVGFGGKRNAVARVSLVNQWGNVVYDKHVRPQEFVQDFRTEVSGVRPRDLRKAEDIYTVQKDLSNLLKGRILVGHALRNDLKVLMMSHPKKHIRDTHSYPPFRNNGRPRALRHLASLHLGCQIQDGEHDPVEDARAAMALYQLVKEAWEASLRYRKESSTAHVKDKKSSKVAK